MSYTETMMEYVYDQYCLSYNMEDALDFLYKSFSEKKQLEGTVSIKTGKLDKSISIKGKYNLNWFDFDNGIKSCIVKISP